MTTPDIGEGAAMGQHILKPLGLVPRRGKSPVKSLMIVPGWFRVLGYTTQNHKASYIQHEMLGQL